MIKKFKRLIDNAFGDDNKQDYFKRNRYNFLQLIDKINAMEMVSDVIIDEKTGIEIYVDDKVSRDMLIDILQNFSVLDNLVQDECKKEYEESHFEVKNYQFAPAWIKVTDKEVVIGYWGIEVNTDFDKSFVKVDGKWRMK